MTGSPVHKITRRTLLRATTATAATTAFAVGPTTGALAAPVPAAPDSADGHGGWPFRDLDDKIRAGMKKYAIPGVSVGLLYRGREYVRGYGVTNVDHPTAVDGDTVFRVASNTKTFTGTTVMRLVEQGKLNLDATVRTYLPDFRTS